MTTMTTESITLGGGCFWCLEAVFNQLRGVDHVASGYAGGAVPQPTYQQVCSGQTGHAEVVQVTFDPAVIAFAEILTVFFDVHDPTTRNRQGADVGTQYRSAIFYHSAEQKARSETMIADLNVSGRWPSPLVTEVMPLTEFYEAGDYHQEYYAHNSTQPYCRAVIAPKVTQFEVHFATKLKGFS